MPKHSELTITPALVAHELGHAAAAIQAGCLVGVLSAVDDELEMMPVPTSGLGNQANQIITWAGPAAGLGFAMAASGKATDLQMPGRAIAAACLELPADVSATSDRDLEDMRATSAEDLEAILPALEGAYRFGWMLAITANVEERVAELGELLVNGKSVFITSEWIDAFYDEGTLPPWCDQPPPPEGNSGTSLPDLRQSPEFHQFLATLQQDAA